MTDTEKLQKIKEIVKQAESKTFLQSNYVIAIEKIESIVNQQPEPQRLPFSWEQYQTGKFTVETRDGRKVEQFHKFEALNDDEDLLGVVEESIFSWKSKNGIYSELESKHDLFLIPIQQEPEVRYFNIYRNSNNATAIQLRNSISSCVANNLSDAIGIAKQSVYPDGTITFEVVKYYNHE